ncbi:MAG: cardiolipin synthase [Phycisphaerales bacterium]|jgi:cardiolipin synthase A/B|nr:cardiolipin synthase [Phycisphaerales bacterium]
MTIFVLIAAVSHVLGVLSSISALMSTRTPQGTIAWIVSLNTLPYFAVPAYWIFGRSKFQGYVFARKGQDSALRTALMGLREKTASAVSSHGQEYGRVRAVEMLAQMPFSTGNHTELLVDGEATFNSIFEGIAQARHYLLVQYYIVRDDEIGRELKDKLIAKAKEGLRVYFLYDEIGSHKLPRAYISQLANAGVSIHPFHSTRGRQNRFQLNFRNHRKIVIADGRVGWVGGLNVGDEYMGRSDKFGPWRDTHMRLEGPAVMGLQLAFVEDWHWATDDVLDLTWNPDPAPDGDRHVLIVPSGPADAVETASLMFQHAIHSADEKIWIASPYFVPDEGVIGALQLAVLRGVDVRILIPKKPDSVLVYLSGFAFLGEMIESGVKIYRYAPGFLHQKVFLVDHYVAAVGTANLDNRSFRLNFEITAVVIDDEFASEIEEMFASDFANSSPMTIEQIESKSFWFKLASRAAHLLAPLQ